MLECSFFKKYVEMDYFKFHSVVSHPGLHCLQISLYRMPGINGLTFLVLFLVHVCVFLLFIEYTFLQGDSY